jgi:RNA polymerase sigma-70 factor (ECF subfamily)
VRLQARDASALQELYERDGSSAFRLAYRVLQDGPAAEDAVQEAFAQLWERAPRLDSTGSVRSLLMTMVHRRALDLVRRQGRATPLLDGDVMARIDEEASERLERVLDAVATEGLRAQLRTAINALPAEQRTVLDLGYFQGMTLSQIAAKEGISLGTVKSRLRLAMRKLSGALMTETQRDDA